MPCFNEEEVINTTLDRIIKLSLSIKNYSWELIIVDDGSKDKTSDLIKKFNQRKIDIHLIRFSRNFGHQQAIQAGLDNCSGHAAIIIDADLQDPPELAMQMIYEWERGFHVVYGMRSKRLEENKFKRLTFPKINREFGFALGLSAALSFGDLGVIALFGSENFQTLPWVLYQITNILLYS